MAFLFVSPQNLFTVIAEEASSAPRYLIAFLFMFASKSNETKQIHKTSVFKAAPAKQCNYF